MSDLLQTDKVIVLPFALPPVLACGAWLKNTVCVTRGNEAHVSQLIGDLDSAAARLMLDATVARLCKELNVQPEIVAHDLHPDFYSTQFAQTFAARHGLPLVAVQHHHAHIAAICAEHHLNDAVLGLALDGVGLGTDNTPWGGELLLVAGASFERLGHLAPLPMPGGDRAAREPWRVAAGVLFQLGRGEEIVQRFPNQPGAQTIAMMLQRNANCPTTSSMGRLFDAAAGLLGVNEIQSFEAQAAILFQELAQRHGEVAPLDKGFLIGEGNVLDFSPLLSVLADCPNGHGKYAVPDDDSSHARFPHPILPPAGNPHPIPPPEGEGSFALSSFGGKMDRGLGANESLREFHVNHNAGYGAALFHATIAQGLAEWVELAARRYNMTQTVLGGGCFHNDILLRTLSDRLAAQGMKVLTGRQMQPNDSSISLGQAWVALQSIKQGSY